MGQAAGSTWSPPLHPATTDNSPQAVSLPEATGSWPPVSGTSLAPCGKSQCPAGTGVRGHDRDGKGRHRQGWLPHIDPAGWIGCS